MGTKSNQTTIFTQKLFIAAPLLAGENLKDSPRQSLGILHTINYLFCQFV